MLPPFHTSGLLRQTAVTKRPKNHIDQDAHSTKRRESWNSLREMMKKTQGVNIVPYSFRHFYSLRAHIRGIDAGSVAMSMGHSLEAHLRAYPWASKASTAKAFEIANKKISA